MCIPLKKADLVFNGNIYKKSRKMTSRAQIVMTIGPSSSNFEMLLNLIKNQAKVIRLNFSWADLPDHAKQIDLIRQVEKAAGKKIPIMIDLPGPRIQEGDGHTYAVDAIKVITEKDKEFIKFGIEKNVDYFALSFVGSAADVHECRDLIKQGGGKQKIIAKIERKVALDNLDEIIAATDAVMIARGDLGNEVPLEKIPFVQADIIQKCNKANKPVITATEMLMSMVHNNRPTRADVTDVWNAVLEGSDCVMLSNETTVGKYPLETVQMMQKIIIEAENHHSYERRELTQL
jgi:pyruvate kinase